MSGGTHPHVTMATVTLIHPDSAPAESRFMVEDKRDPPNTPLQTGC